MTPIQTTRIITRKGDRLHDTINNLSILLQAIGVANAYLATGSATFKPGSFCQVVSPVGGLTLIFPNYGPIQTVLAHKYPDLIGMEILPAIPDLSPPGSITVMGYKSVMLSIFCPAFILFYEMHKRWIWDKFGPIENWPSIFAFGRTIRNSIAHGGKLDIKSKESPTSWKSLTYSHADHGKQVIGTDMGEGDICYLMFEMSDELDKLNCPVF